MAARPKSLIDYVTFRLNVLTDIAHQNATAVYLKACGVSLRELRVLRYAEIEPGLLQGRLASLIYVEKTLVSKMVTSLAGRGLLLRKIGENDARNVTLWLTPEGQNVVDICDPIGRRLEREMMAVLSADERRLFKQCIEKVTDGLIAEREKLEK